MPRYVIYARKSTESEDRQVLSIESQVRELQALASRQGMTVEGVLTESRSAKAPGRPVFGTLMRDVHRGRINGIVTWKMDRLARNHLDTGQVLQALADGLLERVITIDRTYTPSGNDRFIGNFELGMATKYIDDLRQNVKRGILAKLQKGWVSGLPPLGYLNDKATKTIVKDPERFDLVRRMWDMVLTGSVRPERVRQMATEQWGLRTRTFKRIGGKPLTMSMIYRLLGSPFYMGILRHRSGETFVGAHPPMVSREEFARVQELIGRPGRPRPKKHEWPYTGLMHCGSCGASVTGEEHVKKSGLRFVYYHCTHRKSGVTCDEPAVAVRDLESQVARALERLNLPAPVHDWLLRKSRGSLEIERLQRDRARASLERAVQDSSKQEEELLSLRLRGLVKDEVFLAKRQELEERRREVEGRLRGASTRAEDVQRKIEAVFTFAQKAKETFVSGTPVQKRMVLEAVGSNYLLTSRKVTLTLKKPFEILAQASALSNWCATWEDVRTWLLETTEYFELPEEILARCSFMHDSRLSPHVEPC